MSGELTTTVAVPANGATNHALLKPLQFLVCKGPENDRKWTLGEDAVKYLESIEEPLAVVSIAGIYRTGKSFILNQLAGRVDGFDIGPTVQACTEGIWLWTVDDAAIEGTNPGWRYILLDTEGIGSFENTETYDIQVFSLALLLGSFFIYNSVNSIDETAIDKLSLVVELTKHIKVQAEGGDQKKKQLESSFRAYFPNFLWLVRDFALELNINGTAITSRQYLENALNPVKGDPARVGSKNQIRDCIKAFFPDRDCFTLVRPVAQESQLQQLARLSQEELRPEYRDALGQLRHHIYSRVQLKKINNQPLNGPMLVELTRNYVTAINEGGVPTISTAWENVVEHETQKAFETAMKHYATSFEHALNLSPHSGIADEEALLQIHQNSEASAWDIFRTKAIGGGYFLRRDDLDKSLKEAFAKARDLNRQKSLTECEKLIKGLTKSIDDAVNTGEITSVELLEEEWERKLDAYQATARGPARYQVEASFLEKKLLESARRVHNGILKQTTYEMETKIKNLEEKHNKEYSRLENLYQEQDLNRKTAEERIKGLQTEAAEWKEAFKGLEDEKKELIDIALKLQERVAKHEGKALEASVMSSKQLAEYQDNDGNCLVM